MNSLSFFIVGLPRSGTKLLRELLNNHEKIFIPSIEAYFIPHLVRKYRGKILNDQEILEAIEEIKSSLFFFYYRQKNSFNFESVKRNNISVDELIADVFQKIAVSQTGKPAPVLGDKTPRNIMHLQLLLNSFSESKIIHIVRDPRDNVLSARNMWNKNINRAAYKWQKGVDMVDKITDSERFIEIRYEDLLTDTRTVLKEVCLFIGVEYQEGMDQLSKTVENKNGRIDKANFGKYRRELNSKEIKYIEQLTRKGLQKYNYQPMFEEVDFIDRPSSLHLYWWQLHDILNLMHYNFRKHGLIKGIEKMLKARKHA